MSTQTVIAEKIPPILLRVLASTFDLYYASQAAHWNIEGPLFIQLHALFKDMYDDAASAVDEIAERIRQLETTIPMSPVELLKQSSLALSYDKSMIDLLLDAHTKLEEQWKSIAVVADAAEDVTTVDMAGRRAGAHGKFCWILRSLQKPQN